MTAPRPDRLVLIGMMGAGKTTTALALATRLGWPVRDSDVVLAERTGRTGAELAATEGIEHLHRLEEEVLLDALRSEGPLIVTAAASVVDSERARAALAGSGAVVVWLDAPVDDLVVRMASADHRRPLDRAGTDALLARRRTHLAEIAHLRLDARTPTGELVEEVVRAVAPRPPSPTPRPTGRPRTP